MGSLRARDVSDKVVNRKFLEANRAMEKVEWAGSPTKVVGGVDCGFRKGGDPTVIDFCEVGKAVDGVTVADFGGKDAIKIPRVRAPRTRLRSRWPWGFLTGAKSAGAMTWRLTSPATAA